MLAVAALITPLFPVAAGCSLFLDTSGLDTGSGDSSRPDAMDATTDHHAPSDSASDRRTASDATADHATTDTGREAAAKDAGTDGRDSGASPDADSGPCPTGRGPTMVALDYGSPFCIDSTEVTVGQYKQFVAAVTAGYTPVSAPRCAWNTTFAMPASTFCTMPDDFPASCVNWCQAYSFCAWSGKHLCGALLGGSIPYASALDVGVASWAAACTSGGANTYSFGNTYMSYCNMPDPANDGGTGEPLAVASEPQCVGPAGVFDLLGNASEWVDSCQIDMASATGDTDICDHLGGASSSYKACLILDNDVRGVGEYDGYPLGFRCCSP